MNAIRHLAYVFLAIGLMGSPAAIAGEQTITLNVEKMICPLCSNSVKKALEGVPGVTKASVSLRDKSAVVTFDDSKADLAAITAATAKVGFPSSQR